MDAPVARQKTFTWHRPTGDADDPWAWLRDRDDPDTIAYLEDENAYYADWLKGHDELAEELFEELKSRVQQTDVSAPVLKDGWWYVTRTEEGSDY
ncbi:MAG: oligopeptidase B, partial [Jatrophihabitantaceae bacterium]